MDAKKKLKKSRNKMVAGVCAGLAEYVNIDVTLMRVAYVLLSICTAFAGLLAYIILAIIMPNPDAE